MPWYQPLDPSTSQPARSGLLCRESFETHSHRCLVRAILLRNDIGPSILAWFLQDVPLRQLQAPSIGPLDLDHVGVIEPDCQKFQVRDLVEITAHDSEGAVVALIVIPLLSEIRPINGKSSEVGAVDCEIAGSFFYHQVLVNDKVVRGNEKVVCLVADKGGHWGGGGRRTYIIMGGVGFITID